VSWTNRRVGISGEDGSIVSREELIAVAESYINPKEVRSTEVILPHDHQDRSLDPAIFCCMVELPHEHTPEMVYEVEVYAGGQSLPERRQIESAMQRLKYFN